MDPIEVLPSQLIFGTKRIQGWLAGIPTDSEDTLRFAEMTGVRPMIEKYPARECRRRIRSHDERESRIPRRLDHVRSNDARGEIR
jgi:D-arabinose 1-dehydrogenase-like Zn-dependent alcohol dehydrogenase